MAEGTPNIVKYVAIAGGVVLAYKGYSAVSNYMEKKKQEGQLKTDQSSTITAPKGKPLFDLNGKPITSANLANIASDIENATSYPRDQERAMRAFKSTPFGKVKDLETFYLNKYGEQLRDRLINRLSDENWIKLKFYLR